MISTFLYFSACAFIGWWVESSYRSVREGKLVNSGFLSGPFIPIYGFGGVLLMSLTKIVDVFPYPLSWIVLLASPTVLEYIASLILEKSFSMRLWDYSHYPFNFHGRICFLYSLFWAGLSYLGITVLQPLLLAWIGQLPIERGYFIAGALSMYFFMDTWASVKTLVNFKDFTRELKDAVAKGTTLLPLFPHDTKRLPRDFRRLIRPLRAFPFLKRELRPSLHVIPEWVSSRMERLIGGWRRK